ncbi:MAG: glycosyl hydrolase family 65 protein [Aliidongia sp.]
MTRNAAIQSRIPADEPWLIEPMASDAAIRLGVSADDPWVMVQEGFDPDLEAKHETLFALADGALGVRGGLEEWTSPSDGMFLAEVFERTQIHYHERHPGFAEATDTRVPVADSKRIAVLIDNEPVDPTCGVVRSFRRSLDLRTGRATRDMLWEAPSGRLVELSAERTLFFAQPGTMALRFTVTAVNFAGRVTLVSGIAAARAVEPQGDDPRIGAELAGGGLRVVDTILDAEAPGLVQETRHSRIAVACRQSQRVLTADVARLAPAVTSQGVSQGFAAELAPGDTIGIEKFVAYAWQPTGRDGIADTVRTLFDRSGAMLRRLAAGDFDRNASTQAQILDNFWADSTLAIDGDPKAQEALRFNLFHLFQSTSRSGCASLAAKGLTGEGYEGHYFWDTEAFAAPMLIFTAPALVRSMLEWRYRTLDRARAHARELGHQRGALFAWRTISGDECSSHYPSGSAQYHINAAVAYAIRLYDAGTGDDEFMAAMGAEILFETARIWLEIGHFNARKGGAFCIAGVTGPDEYTALVDNNYYTNAMAQRHLRFAASVAARLGADRPATYSALAARLGLSEAEIVEWRRAADAMYLPYDEELGIHKQDDGFLDRPVWAPAATEAGDHRPLLLRYHPLTLYRYQLCKQADLILAMVLSGLDVEPAAKRRNFEYYEPITVHDSTLSPSTFSILAAEIGDRDKAYRYFTRCARVDLDDSHGNVRHGAHMAAMAGSWLALTWGFAGLRCEGPCLAFAPQLPAEWRGYDFGLVWRNRRLRVAVTGDSVCYTLDAGPALRIRHYGRDVDLPGGGACRLGSEAVP